MVLKATGKNVMYFHLQMNVNAAEDTCSGQEWYVHNVSEI